MIYLYCYILFLSIDSNEEDEILSILRDRLHVEGIGNEDEDDDAMETDKDDGVNADDDGWGTTCGRPSGLPFNPPRPPGPILGMDREKTIRFLPTVRERFYARVSLFKLQFTNKSS